MSVHSLIDYIADPARKAALAQATGCSPLWLYQISIAWRGKRASKVLALAIEGATDGAVQKSDLRPDFWPPEPATQKVA